MSQQYESIQKQMVDWLIVWCLMLFSTVMWRGGKYTYPSFPGVLLTSTPDNILSQPLAAFPHNHCQNNGQWWERNESCHNDYHQSLVRILAEPGIEPATFFSKARNAINWPMGLGPKNDECLFLKQIIISTSHSNILTHLIPSDPLYLFCMCSTWGGHFQ